MRTQEEKPEVTASDRCCWTRAPGTNPWWPATLATALTALLSFLLWKVKHPWLLEGLIFPLLSLVSVLPEAVVMRLIVIKIFPEM